MQQRNSTAADGCDRKMSGYKDLMQNLESEMPTWRGVQTIQSFEPGFVTIGMSAAELTVP